MPETSYYFETLALLLQGWFLGAALGRFLGWTPDDAELLAFRPEGCLRQLLRETRRDLLIAMACFMALLAIRATT
jgi:hypothetical protein